MFCLSGALTLLLTDDQSWGKAGIGLTLQECTSTLGSSVVTDLCGDPHTLFPYTNDVDTTQQGFPLFDHGVVFSVAYGFLNLEIPQDRVMSNGGAVISLCVHICICV